MISRSFDGSISFISTEEDYYQKGMHFAIRISGKHHSSFPLPMSKPIRPDFEEISSSVPEMPLVRAILKKNEPTF